MNKIDFKKENKHLYNPSTKVPSLVDVPKMNFLMVDGEGDPNTSQAFQDGIEALYSLSYTLKFMLKKQGSYDYSVLPLEGLWWADNMAEFSVDMKGDWKWTAMIMQPEFVTSELFQDAMLEVERKKNPAALSKVRFESYDEGLSAQIMHIGPFSEEGSAVAKLHAFIEEHGYSRRGKHHEIYLSDFRKTAPEKLKTVIRQPVQK